MNPLPDSPRVRADRRQRLERTIEQTKRDPPHNLAAIVQDDLGVDLSTYYGGEPIAHPFGKASGQLSCTRGQVEDDLASGIGFIVLKTVIAEDESGRRKMGEWATQETRMRVHQRRGAEGREGWTVTWKGRGWHGSLDEYLAFAGDAIAAGVSQGVPVVPSVKYDLPAGAGEYRTAEYEYTTGALMEVWRNAGAPGSLVLEKDFSPTLAGDMRASQTSDVLRWLVDVPRLIRKAVAGQVRVGVKVMNALRDDDFQLEMLECFTRSASSPGSASFLVVFNRLFDRTEGVAYGGWDLSDRNLRVLDAALERRLALPPLSATGNICSGKMMIDYARRGCENGQIHTFFQLPNSEYTAGGGQRTARALHTLMLHPTDGLVAWMWHLAETGEIQERDGVLHFYDLVRASGGGGVEGA